MFVKHCPDPQLSRIFKCKPISELKDIEVRIDEFQRELRASVRFLQLILLQLWKVMLYVALLNLGMKHHSAFQVFPFLPVHTVQPAQLQLALSPVTSNL